MTRAGRGWALCAAGGAAFLGVLVMVATATGLARWDGPVLRWMVEHRTPAWTACWQAVSTLFGPALLPMLVAAGCVVWWAATRTLRGPLLLVGAMAFQGVLALVLKAVVERPRPPDVAQLVPGSVATHSFPSGHTMGATVLAFALLVLLGETPRSHRWWWAGVSIASGVVVLVATSRLYLGYHFLTDVVGGAAAGIAVVGLLVVVAAHTASGSASVVDAPGS